MSAPREGEPASTGREVEDQLRQLTKGFEQVLEISPTAIVFTDLANRIASWNPAAERLFGYSAEEAAGRDLDDLVASTDALHAEAVQFRQRVAASEHVRTISRRTRKDGSFVDVELLAAPLVVDGEPVGTFAIYHDITELNRQRRFLEALLEVSPEAIVTTDLDDTVTSWNPSAERLFGYTAEEAIGHDIDELVSRRADLYAEGKELNRGAMESPMAHLVTQRTRKDGSLVDVDIVGGPVTVGGELVAKHVFYHDISELQEQKRYFESLLEISPTAIVITDLESKITSWNPAAERLFGFTRGGGRRADHRRPRRRHGLNSTRTPWVTPGRRTGRAGAGIDPADPEGRNAGRRRAPHRADVGGRRAGRLYYVIYHDITEVQQQKRWLESVLKLSPTAIITIDHEMNVTSWNPGAERLFGYTRRGGDRAPTSTISSRRRPSSTRKPLGYSEAAAGRSGPRDHASDPQGRLTGRRGALRRACRSSAGERVGHSVIYHDIGEIQRQKRYYEALVQWSPNAIVLMDPQGTVTSWNPAAERLFGYTAEEAIGRHIDDLVATDASVRAEAESRDRTG